MCKAVCGRSPLSGDEWLPNGYAQIAKIEPNTMLTTKELRSIKPNVWLSDGGPRGAGTLVFRRTTEGVKIYFRHIQSDGTRYALPLGNYDEAGRNGQSLTRARARAAELSKLYTSGIRDLRQYLQDLEDSAKAAEEAQKVAEESQKALEEEANAAAQREIEEQGQYTLKALCEAYTNHLDNLGKTQSARAAKSLFKCHLFESQSDLANIPAKNITPHQIALIIRKIREAGKERAAGVVRSYLRAAYGAGIRAPFDSSLPAGLIAFGVESNPVDAIPAIPVRAGNRTLSNEEMGNYVKALKDNLPDQALKLALYAGGQRMSQILRARVSDFNPNTQVLKLWDNKGKRLAPREHILPLADEGAALVAKLVSRAIDKANKFAKSKGIVPIPNPPLFYSTGESIMSQSTPGKRAMEICGELKGEPFDLRDIRRTVETMLASMGISRDVRAQLLSHGLSGVQQLHYDRHSYMSEKADALIRWEQYLEGLNSTAQADDQMVP